VPPSTDPAAGAEDLRPSVAALSAAEVVEAVGDARWVPELGAEHGVRISGVTLDSRRVRTGDLYAALPGGHTHGARFAVSALQSGASLMLTDPHGVALADGVAIPICEVDDPRARLGAVSAAIYGHPASRLLMLAVTGTNGKTTTSYLLHAGLARAGHLPGLIGTIETRIGDRHLPSVRTTPEAPDLHALLAVMLEHGATACAMEVSSHALALHRVDAVRYDVVGFTNLSQDHLDFHGSFENYFAAKAQLFTPDRAHAGVICIDDEWGRRLAATSDIAVTTFTTSACAGPDDAHGPDDTDGPVDPGADWRVADAVPDPQGPGMLVTLVHREGERWSLVSPLPGDYNVANTCLAALMLRVAGVAPRIAAEGVAGCPGVPGRMQVVDETAHGLPLGVVDYSHSPGSVEAALRALRRSGADPLVIVLGAGGDRDPGKREQMGAAAARAADAVIVTDDNPRSEPPQRIRDAVLAGARAVRNQAGGVAPVIEEVDDRRAAIGAALDLAMRLTSSSTARPTVLLAGKGHETGQEVAGTVYPFDDRVVLAEQLAALRRQMEDRPG
jgi:UDP-N-acetylmuramoyl-L-alanyl-D-glutamate--2,6-diaminopimelate ligase